MISLEENLLLSIVIPAFNEEAWVSNCLKSLSQELGRKGYHAEIILVNNASTDRTRHIAESYPGITVVDEPHKGLARARQAGFMVSSGNLIANIDADTKLPPGWIDTVLREFQQNSNLVALSGPFIYYDLSIVTRVLVRLYYFCAAGLHAVNHRILGAGAVIQGGNFVLRRRALEKIGGYDPRFEFYGEDADIACRIQKVGDVKFTFKLPMQSSGRRLKEEGSVTVGFRYIVNYFWTTFLREPFTKGSRDIRTDPNSS